MRSALAPVPTLPPRPHFYHQGTKYDLSLMGWVEFDGDKMRVAADIGGRYYLVTGPIEGNQYCYQRELEGPYEATLEEALAHWRSTLNLAPEQFVYTPGL